MATILGSYRDAVAFRPDRFNPVLLAAGAHMKAVLTCLEPGQFIPVHRPGVDMTLLVLEGDGQIIAGMSRRLSIPERSSLFPRARRAESRRRPDSLRCTS